jgi:hypothetical protein
MSAFDGADGSFRQHVSAMDIGTISGIVRGGSIAIAEQLTSEFPGQSGHALPAYLRQILVNGGRRSERSAGAPAHRPGDEVEYRNLPCRTDPRAQAQISSGAAVTETIAPAGRDMTTLPSTAGHFTT